MGQRIVFEKDDLTTSKGTLFSHGEVCTVSRWVFLGRIAQFMIFLLAHPLVTDPFVWIPKAAKLCAFVSYRDFSSLV